MSDFIAQYGTEELTFAMPISLMDAQVYITFEQEHRVVLEKTNEDMEISADEIVLPLTQADTARFGVGQLDIQIRAIFEDGSAPVSDWMHTEVVRTAKRGILTYDAR